MRLDLDEIRERIGRLGLMTDSRLSNEKRRVIGDLLLFAEAASRPAQQDEPQWHYQWHYPSCAPYCVIKHGPPADQQDEAPADWYVRDGHYDDGVTFHYCEERGPVQAHCVLHEHHGHPYHQWAWPTIEQRARAEAGAVAAQPSPSADHPHSDPGDGRTECQVCGKYVWPVTHSCKGVPVTDAAKARAVAAQPSSNEPECGDCDRGIEFSGDEPLHRCANGCPVTHPDFAHYSEVELGGPAADVPAGDQQ